VKETDREAAARKRIGAVLKDKWRLEELLGVGGVASVYAARHKNGKRVAVKVLHPAFAADDRVVTRFAREGYLANRIEHPGAVVIDDDDIDPEHGPFVVMELCDGETLEQWRRRLGGRVQPADIRPVLAKLLEVLAVAHRAGVVHRDLKPENVMLLGSGEVKILDFGLARAREVWSGQSGLTQPESLLGTPGFMAPEQAMGRWERVDQRTDLWAVGAIAFVLLSGRPVHEGDSLQALLVTAATEPARSLGEVSPDLPVELVAIVDRALSFAKAERFESAEDMVAALEETRSPATAAPVASRRASARVWPIAALVIGGIGLAVALALGLTASPSHGERPRDEDAAPRTDLSERGGDETNGPAALATADEPLAPGPDTAATPGAPNAPSASPSPAAGAIASPPPVKPSPEPPDAAPSADAGASALDRRK
jgi:eukaryotic-like serine/threonine-protein kinase